MIECNERNFMWRGQTIRALIPASIVSLQLPEADEEPIITWDETEMTWEQFLDRFSTFAREYEEVPF